MVELTLIKPTHIKFWLRITWLRNILETTTKEDRPPPLHIFSAQVAKEAVKIFKKECSCTEKEAAICLEDWVNGEFTN